jgi:hypothetical protein
LALVNNSPGKFTRNTVSITHRHKFSPETKKNIINEVRKGKHLEDSEHM